jgi:hypothetical protein
VTPPYPAWALTDAALVSVATLLRRYHAAAATFDPAPYRWPASPPEPFTGGLVLHNDPNLDNVVFRHGRAVALIDFDLASPGTRVWDVAAAARLWAPLRQDADVRDARHGRVLHRFRLFADAYGLTEAERAVLVDAVIANHDWLYEVGGPAPGPGTPVSPTTGRRPGTGRPGPATGTSGPSRSCGRRSPRSREPAQRRSWNRSETSTTEVHATTPTTSSTSAVTSPGRASMINPPSVSASAAPPVADK